MELPELLNKLTLLLNAGETIHQAIHRCASFNEAEEEHPLRREWAKLSRSLKDNKPFVLAMEEFSRSCSVLEVSMFSTSVLMNFRRGGSDFVASLQELSHTLWERRKATAKIIGEEAASKLVFPMVLLFCTVMIIVAAPAVLMMN
ncbi:Bacterial type II secretion system protein F domain protein [compost metagenome]